MNSSIRPTRMYVDLNAIAHNIKEIKERLKPETQLMAVIKASGYGSGAVNIVNTLIDNGAERLAVAIAEEGIQLRKRGVSIPILILIQPFQTQLKDFLEYDLIPTITHYELAKELNDICQAGSKIVKVHIEVDTGMGRMGIPDGKAVDLIADISALKNIQVEGIYTHFACSDCDVEYTRSQIERFEAVLRGLKERGIEIPLKHACNSAAIINFPEAHYDIVRPGLMLYGYYPDQSLRDKLELMPSLTLKSKVAYIKEVPPGTSVSYNCTYTTERVSKIATIPVGYADGYRRELSNKGSVVINGYGAPIVGTVCMDMFMVDVTHIPDVKAGDEVILFDHSNITVDEIAKLCGTINYEIIAIVGSRVPRVYLD